MVLTCAGESTTVYDGYIPAPYRPLVERFFAAHAYIPVTPAWTNTGNNGHQGTRARQETRQYELYLAALLNKIT